MIKNIFLLLSVLLLAGCAIPLKGYEMVPKTQVYDELGTKLDRKVTLGNVAADKGLGGQGAPVVTDEYKEALVSALRQAGWYNADQNAPYILNAQMTKIEQPIFGFNFTVKSTAHYSLVKVKDNKVIYDQTITLPCTVVFAEAWDAAIRLRKATACAVGENITHLLKVLSQEKL